MLCVCVLSRRKGDDFASLFCLSDPFSPKKHSPSPERRRAANKAAFKSGRDRDDLYTDAWDGSEWKGSKVNILTVLIAISVAVPAASIAFAFWSYGRYWG